MAGANSIAFAEEETHENGKTKVGFDERGAAKDASN